MPENDGKYAYKETYAPNGGELDKDMQYFDVKDQFYSRDPVTGAVENGILNRNSTAVVDCILKALQCCITLSHVVYT